MYRYSNKKYNDLLFVMGVVRIGTLYDFRKSEHKDKIGDSNEGIKTIFHNKDLQTNSEDELSNEQKTILKGYKELGGININGYGNITLINNTVKQKINSSDYFIFCTSTEFNIKNAFGEYNSCYKIINPDKFYDEITIALNKIRPIKFIGYFKITYKDRIEEWVENGNKLHPALIKELEYKGQAEIRAIWEPLDKSVPIEPIKLASYKLGKYMQHQPLI